MQIDNYKNQLLVAMPTMQGDFFSKAVIFVYEHSATEGTIGFTINKPLSATLGNVFQHLNIPIKKQSVTGIPVFSGGPVGPDQGFVIHDQMSLAENPADKEVTISTSRDMLQSIAKGKGPEHFLITLGYAGWEAMQLEAEILRNDWLVVPFQKRLLFEVPIAERWIAAAKSVGIDVNKLSGHIGHA